MKKDNEKIYTNNLITLCHIIDEFEEFEKRLIPNISPKYNRNFIFKLWDISKGKSRIGAKKAKRFYKENQLVIDTINKYSNVPTFINENYGWYGEDTGSYSFFYNYLLKHKEEIPQIIELLEKIKKLGFSKIEFNEELDFTKDTYYVFPSFDKNYDLTYVANVQVMPSYVSSIIYKTEDSNYKMKLKLLGVTDKKISEYGKEIILNSLLFNPNLLPDEIDKEHIFEQLLKKKNDQKENAATIRNSVDLSITISDLEMQYFITNEIVSRLNGVKNKEELIAVLSSINEDIEKLKKLSKEYDNSISKENPLLTEEVLENEKKLYLNRRELSKIDLC